MKHLSQEDIDQRLELVKHYAESIQRQTFIIDKVYYLMILSGFALFIFFIMEVGHDVTLSMAMFCFAIAAIHHWLSFQLVDTKVRQNNLVLEVNGDALIKILPIVEQMEEDIQLLKDENEMVKGVVLNAQ